jgi:glutathione synthase/RimK-type ligase-like ATP-grasp enzyme
MILIVSYPNNEHVDEVCRHLAAPPVIVDTGSFPVTLGLTAALDNHHECLRLSPPGSPPVCLCQIGAVWYRRIGAFTFHDDLVDPTARLFAWSEANEALLGVWYSLDAYWMNPPLADEVSQRKIRQLQVARQVGLSIPDTLVTNQPDAAREFLAGHGVDQVVRKAFRNIAQAPRETWRLGVEDIDKLDAVRYTPVIFQKYVPADLDLRVTVVGDDIFAAAVKSEAAYAADYRPGLGSATVTPYTLPDDVAQRMMALMRVFGLQYGAIDFRVTPEGEHVFLEVNPAGEFLFISRRTGQPIPEAIAAALERHDRRRPAAAPC